MENSQLLSFFDTNEFSKLTTLERNTVYCYIMTETKQMTTEQLVGKFNQSPKLIESWTYYGKGLYTDYKNNKINIQYEKVKSF